MDDPPLRERFEPVVPGITRIPFGDVAAVDAAVGADTAAVIMETIPATGGYLLPPEGWLEALRRICDERGALLILDEVQSGLCRTGRIWALEHFGGVVPDILVTGKGISAGVYPISACCFGDRVEAHFAADPFFHPSSFAGSEIGARVVEAAVDHYADPALCEHVTAMGERLAAGLDGLVARHPDRLAGHHRSRADAGTRHALRRARPSADEAVLRPRPARDLRVQPPADAADHAAAGHLGGRGR